MFGIRTSTLLLGNGNTRAIFFGPVAARRNIVVTSFFVGESDQYRHGVTTSVGAKTSRTTTTTSSSSSSSTSSPSPSSPPSSVSSPSNTTTTTTATDLHQSLFKNPIVQRLWSARQEAKQKARSSSPTTAAASFIKPNSPSSSRVQVSYPFSSDALLWETYQNPWGNIRIGKLLEDLDALAGNIAFFHVHNNQQQQQNLKQQNLPSETDVEQPTDFPVLVTASVDRIRLRRRPTPGCDQSLSGQVTWTGRSSMEIKMCCAEQKPNSSNNNNGEDWLEAYVTFVTLDPHTKRPMVIPPVVPETPEEKHEFDQGAQRAAFKKQLRQQQQQQHSQESDSVQALAQSLLEQASSLIHLPSLANPRDILMDQTSMQNAMVAQPQAQNLHQGIFGGFLMRRAFELAFATAYCFAGARPIFLEVDQVSFTLPVNVGDLLVFNSHVLYTDQGRIQDYYDRDHITTATNKQPSVTTSGGGGAADVHEKALLPLVHIEVEAWVTVPEHAKSQVSNQFYFTFAIDPPPPSSSSDQHFAAAAVSPTTVRRVLPGNIDQARRMATRMRADQEQRKLDRMATTTTTPNVGTIEQNRRRTTTTL